MERKVGQNRQPSSVFESILYRYLLSVLFPIQTRQWAVVSLFWELRVASEKTGELEERLVCLRFRRCSLPLCRSPLTLALDWLKETARSPHTNSLNHTMITASGHLLVKPRSTQGVLWGWGKVHERQKMALLRPHFPPVQFLLCALGSFLKQQRWRGLRLRKLH